MFNFDFSINSIFLYNKYIGGETGQFFVDNGFKFASYLFDPLPFTFLLVLTVWLVSRRFGLKEGIIFAWAPAISAFVSFVLKYTFDISRPVSIKLFVFGSSFPSLHTSVATAYFLMLLHIAKRDKNSHRRKVHYLFCILSILFVGTSRLYLGVHWFSDILGGYILGALAVYFSVYYINKIRNKIR